MNVASSEIAALAAVVRLSGGIRSVAVRADVDPSNLTRFLSGGGGLSEERQLRLEAVLGRKGGQTDATRVLRLQAKRAQNDVEMALRWLFPYGGRVARAAWSAMTRGRILKFVRADLTPEVYAVTDGTARCVIIFPAGPMMPRSLFTTFPSLRWWEDDPDRAVLDLYDPVPWIDGTLDVPSFNAAWPGQGYDPTADDLLQEVRTLGISFAEAIRRIYRGQPR